MSGKAIESWNPFSEGRESAAAIAAGICTPCVSGGALSADGGLVGGSPVDGAPLVAGLVQSTTFTRGGIDSAARHAYSRVSNPTVDELEAVLGRLEGAPPAVAFGTGLAAESALFLAVLRAGDHVVCGRSVYGGTTRLLSQLLSGLGVESTFVDAREVGEIERAIRPETRLVFIETPSNPTLELTDIAAVAAVTRKRGVLLAVDNTFHTAVLQRPLDLGADVTVCSTTKFIDGHSAALGGSIVSRDAKLVERVRWIRKCVGSIQSPLNAWLTLQGIKTLGLRLERQSRTAERLAEWLAGHPAVETVYHPSLASGEAASIAAKQHRRGSDGRPLHGAVLAFELAGGLEAAKRVVQRVRLCRLVEHVGSVETLLTHSATMTHADVPREQRLAAGIGDGLLRLSVGIEDVDDIGRDLAQALLPEVQAGGARWEVGVAAGVGVGVAR